MMAIFNTSSTNPWGAGGAGRAPDPAKSGSYGGGGIDYSLMSDEEKKAYNKVRESDIMQARQAYGRRFGEAESSQYTADSNVADALAQYRNAASGNAPSVAELQMRRGTDQNIANALALSAAGRGGNAALSARQAGSAMAGANQALVGDTAALRAGEIATARQGMADLSMQQQNAAAQRYALAQQGQLGLEDLEMRRFANAQDNQTQLDIAEYQAKIQREMAIMQAKAQLAGAGIHAGGQLVGGLLRLTSDARRKEDIEDGGEGIAKVFRSLKPTTYRYKKDVGEHDFGEGKRVAGVMAQDLEKTELGRAIVKEHSGTKMLDMRGISSLALAGIADLYRRLDKVSHADA